MIDALPSSAGHEDPAGTKAAPQEWFSIPEAASIMQVSARRAHQLLERTPVDLRKPEETGGRPKTLYHFAAHPRLHAHFNAQFHGPTLRILDEKPIAPDDLATAQFRAQAVEEYWALCEFMQEKQAVAQVVAEWTRTPRKREIRWDERLERNRKRKNIRQIQVGPFSMTTLRQWASLYKEMKFEISALAPERKSHVGRTRASVPDTVIDLVHALAISTARADVVVAIERAKETYPGEWPNVSYDTIRRRVLERDPAKAGKSIGTRGIADFRLNHSPDITRDYSDMTYNRLWELDDITEDFYGHGSDPLELVRPYSYSIIRVATRQWICAVTAETPITQDQVRTLVGLAMADRQGGIPDEIKFERGTVACDDYLADLLAGISVHVSKTSMDGGRIFPNSVPDRATGHFQGKGVVESNIRNHHNRLWDATAQVGPDERNTAPARLPNLLAYAKECAKEGRPSILPTPGQWTARIFQALEEHNNRPHSALPEIVDPETGAVRHMSPNEKAVQLKAEEIRIMDERLLPLFFQKGYQVPVTKNGVLLHKHWYGRFDEDLQKLQGTKVMVFAMKEFPGVAFIKELGRCVDAYVAPRYGEEGDAIERKRHIERTKRNQYEKLLERAMQAAGSITTESTKFTSNPVPDRALKIIAPEPMRARAESMATATTAHRDRKTALDRRFEAGEATAPRAGRRGLMSRATDLEAQLSVLQTKPGQEEDDKFGV